MSKKNAREKLGIIPRRENAIWQFTELYYMFMYNDDILKYDDLLTVLQFYFSQLRRFCNLSLERTRVLLRHPGVAEAGHTVFLT